MNFTSIKLGENNFCHVFPPPQSSFPPHLDLLPSLLNFIFFSWYLATFGPIDGFPGQSIVGGGSGMSVTICC